MSSRKVAFYTLGCRVNQYETRRWMASLPADIELVKPGEEAEIVVINSCLVTKQAERDTRQLIHKARRSNPSAHIIATGCYVDIHDAQELEENLTIIKKEAKEQIPGLIISKLGVTPGTRESLPPWAPSSSRPPLLIQTGCNKRCAYCIIPHARGNSWSRPSAEVLDELSSMVDQGYGEVVLTGINLGSYTEGEHQFPGLLKKMLDLIPDSMRIRIGSIEPEYVTPPLVALMGHPRLAPHLHIPLQGSTEQVLRAMGRPGSTRTFAELCHALLQNRQDLAIGADVIAGFPGETAEDHREGLAFVEALPLAYLHVFPYSPRPGTRAAALPGLPGDVVKQRAKELRAIDERLRSRFLTGLKGAIVQVAPERPVKGSATSWQGMAGQFFQVQFSCSAPPPPLTSVQLTELGEGLPKGVMIG